MHMFYRCIWAG